MLFEKRSCWLRCIARDSSLDLIFPRMQLFRLENKDVPGRWEPWRPRQKHRCSFSFQPPKRFSQLILFTICCQMVCFVWLSLCAWENGLWNHNLSSLCDLKKFSFGFFPTWILPGAWARVGTSGVLDLLLVPGQPALVQVLDNIVLRRKANYPKLWLINYHRGLNFRRKYLTLPRACLMRRQLHRLALDNFKAWNRSYYSTHTESGPQHHLCLTSGLYPAWFHMLSKPSNEDEK